MTDRQRKALRITGWVLLGVFLLAIVGAGIAYSKRDALLQTALDRAVRKAKRDYQLNVRIGQARFTGWKSVAFSNVTVVPDNRDSLARVGQVEVAVRLWPLLTGKVALSALTLNNGLVQIVRRDSLTNIDFLLHRKRDSTAAPSSRRTDLSDVAENVIDNVLSKIPNDLNVRNLLFTLTDYPGKRSARKHRTNDSDDETRPDTIRRVSLLTQSATIADEVVASTLVLNSNEATWHLTGTADPAGREYNLALFAEGRNGVPKPLELAYLQQRYNLKLQADTLRAELRDVDRSGGEFRLEGAGSVRNLRINHPAIARTDVLVPSAAIDARVFVGENYVGVDSASTLHLGSVAARPFVKYTLSPTKVYELQLHTDPLDAQAVFNSFPQGLFESLEGMQVMGKLRYDLAFRLNTALPDSVKFSSGLTPDRFHILKMGRTDFTVINRPFVYTPYEKGKPVRDIVVGPENPDYTPLPAIAPDLRNALLTSEDYTFFTHKGFNEKAFRVSIATNFKEKSFKRGASTISMQLVKNVFLNRNKTLSRKVEEILIVWLIENEHLVPKDRMYEVYLNIIEWGRNVYGIGEAARHYFAKTPGELSLGESIFLAFVVPRPKAALDWFQPDGTLQVRNVRGYFRIIGRIMAQRGLTAPDSGAYGFYDVRLREGLRRQVAPTDSSMRIDTLLTDPADIDNVDDFLKNLFSPDRKPEPERPAVQPERPAETPVAEPVATDTVKTRKQLRQERRERKRREREERDRRENGSG